MLRGWVEGEKDITKFGRTVSLSYKMNSFKNENNPTLLGVTRSLSAVQKWGML
jgi:hypothetical protein